MTDGIRLAAMLEPGSAGTGRRPGAGPACLDPCAAPASLQEHESATGRYTKRSGAVAVALSAVILAACGGGGSDPPAPPPMPASEPPAAQPAPTLGTGPAACTDGTAADFPCSGISLLRRVPLAAMGGEAGNDLWGWADAETGDEYALMGMANGTAFVKVSDPSNPVFLGRLPTHTEASAWRDIKVYRDHAYVVADRSGVHGMQVFDLSRLRGLSGPQTFAADVVYGDFESAHNLAINEETGFAYAVSSNTCGGGLHIVDIRMPNNPMFRACHDVARTHDAQCVIYRGPDADHASREICFNANEDHFAVVDVTDKDAALTLSSSTYPDSGFVHQGWLTDDHRFFLLGDEFDETNLGVPTRTHVFDVSDLDAPVYVFAHELATVATDHNLYVLGSRVFEANYTSGLRVLTFDDLAAREIGEVAFFDTFPQGDDVAFAGAWSVYPYLPSGTILVSDIQSGLFVLSMD